MNCSSVSVFRYESLSLLLLDLRFIDLSEPCLGTLAVVIVGLGLGSLAVFILVLSIELALL